jgi:hypothetical protein
MHIESIRARASRLAADAQILRNAFPAAQHYIADNWTKLRKARTASKATLSAEDSASTLYRFFRSQHVADLRVLVTLATIVFCAYFLILAVVTIVNPTIHLVEYFLRFAWTHFIGLYQHVRHLVPALFRVGAAVRPDSDLEQLLWHGTEVSGRGIKEVIGGMEWSITHSFDVLNAKVLALLIPSVGPAVPIYGGIVAWAYLSAATRLGVVDLFACEICTVCRVSAAFDVGKIYIERHDKCDALIKADHGDEPLGSKTGSSEAKGFVSGEDYFPVFGSNSHDLESLEATVVGHITEFYTYMKTVRDLQRKLAENEPAKIAKTTFANLIYVLYLGHEGARKATKEMIEFEPTKAESIMIILLTELICFTFLSKLYQGDELRFDRLTFRMKSYKEDMDYIESNLKDRDENDKDWGPAVRTMPELRGRYNDMDQEMRVLIAESSKSPHQDNKKEKLAPAQAVA